jgi:hypothetical protein
VRYYGDLLDCLNERHTLSLIIRDNIQSIFDKTVINGSPNKFLILDFFSRHAVGCSDISQKLHTFYSSVLRSWLAPLIPTPVAMMPFVESWCLRIQDSMMESSDPDRGLLLSECLSMKLPSNYSAKNVVISPLPVFFYWDGLDAQMTDLFISEWFSDLRSVPSCGIKSVYFDVSGSFDKQTADVSFIGVNRPVPVPSTLKFFPIIQRPPEGGCMDEELVPLPVRTFLDFNFIIFGTNLSQCALGYNNIGMKYYRPSRAGGDWFRCVNVGF